MFAIAQETAIQRRRCAEQVHQQPVGAAEIADQRQIALGLEIDRARRGLLVRMQQPPHFFVQRIVVVDAGDALASCGRNAARGRCGTRTSACRCSTCRIARSECRRRCRAAGPAWSCSTGSRRRVPRRRNDAASSSFSSVMRGVVFGRRDQFEQRLGIVGGQRRMRERRAERARMRRQRELAVVRDAQAFLFDAAQAASSARRAAGLRQHGQAVRERVGRAGRCRVWH